MAELNLTQEEADALMAVEKHRVNDDPVMYPARGNAISIPLISHDRREHFLLDINRGRIDFQKVTYQNRCRQVIVLVRLDIIGPAHLNPDGTEIPTPHLHLYREGYGDKWAVPVPTDQFANLQDLLRTLRDFMRYCNVTRPPLLDTGLFS